MEATDFDVRWTAKYAYYYAKPDADEYTRCVDASREAGYVGPSAASYDLTDVPDSFPHCDDSEPEEDGVEGNG